MRFPKIKHARFCRALMYIIVCAPSVLAIIAAFCFDFIPKIAEAVICAVLLVGLAVFIFREYMVLLFLDLLLGLESCSRTARTQYKLPERFKSEKIKGRIARFGKRCVPVKSFIQPDNLRYSFTPSLTVYNSGFEKVIAEYNTDMLDKPLFELILSSAKKNSKALIGTKKQIFLDSAQKAASLKRLTVVIIFTNYIDVSFSAELYKEICEQSGDEFDDALLPCVIDLSHRTCVFNSFKNPSFGFGSAAVNSGINLIRRLIFGGKLPLKGNEFYLPGAKEDEKELEKSLWELWKDTRSEVKKFEKDFGKRFKRMSDRQITVENDELYIKWGEQGVFLYFERDEEARTVALDNMEFWIYPKTQKISKETIAEMEQEIKDYFRATGYSATFKKYDKTK